MEEKMCLGGNRKVERVSLQLRRYAQEVRMLVTLPALKCQNRDCPLPIELPRPSLLQWPTDTWTRIFACPRCGHVYHYAKRDVCGRQSLTLARDQETVRAAESLPFVLCVEVRCGEQNCGLSARIHTISNAWRTKEELAPIVANWTFHIECPAGHSIDKASDFDLCSADWQV
jgi:hypothetical protein